jgi:hypothetical protein
MLTLSPHEHENLTRLLQKDTKKIWSLKLFARRRTSNGAGGVSGDARAPREKLVSAVNLRDTGDKSNGNDSKADETSEENVSAISS